MRQQQAEAVQQREIDQAKADTASQYEAQESKQAAQRLDESYRPDEKRTHYPEGSRLFALAEGSTERVSVLCFPSEWGYSAAVISATEWRQISHLQGCDSSVTRGGDVIGYYGKHAVGYMNGLVPK